VTRPTLHLVPADVWGGRDPAAPYLPAAYEADGFIHCTDGDAEMTAVANRFYRADPRPFLLLTLDLDRTGSPWRFDEPGSPYPHIYGPVDPAAVLEVRRMVRGPDGAFAGPAAPEAAR
jgi:uncharacterized protein (DUF952 family)